MSQYLPEVAWSTYARNVLLGNTPYRYKLTVNYLDPNEPGANTMEMQVGDWFIDNAGYPFLIEEINGAQLTVYDVNERGDGVTSAYGPYPDKIGYVYRPKNGAFMLTQAQLRKLDPSASDIIIPIEKGIVWKYRGLNIIGDTFDLQNVTKLVLENIQIEELSEDGWQGGKTVKLTATYPPQGIVVSTGTDWDISIVPSTGYMYYTGSNWQFKNEEYALSSHTHTKSQITDFAHTHIKSDITDFAHTHSKSEITDFSHAHTKSEITDFSHTHTPSEVGLSNVTNDAQLKRSSGDFNSFSQKSTPVDNDVFLIEDSAASYAKKKTLWSNIKSVLKTYFDSIYAAVSHTHTKSQITDFSHNHPISEVTNLQSSLDAKVNTSDVVITATANKILKLDANAKLPASITGNSATATKLETARTLTIGSTGKSFDGSAGVSWSLAEIGAAATSHTHSKLGTLNGLILGTIGELSAVSGVQGDILYHNGTTWTVLNAGTNGYFLKTQGAGANPVWASPTGNHAGLSNLPWTSSGHTGTNFSIPNFSATGVATEIAPNTTTTRKYLSMLGDGTNGALPTWEEIAASSSQWITSGSDIYYNGGNVGIGTEPTYKLHLTATPPANGGVVYIRDTVSLGNDSFAAIGFSSSPGYDWFVGKATTSAGAGLFQIRDQAHNVRMSISENGNVGIGTTSPGYGFESALSTASLGNKAVIIGCNDEIWTQPQTNDVAALYINYRGYADGLTQFRNLYIANGKGTIITSFIGASGNVGIGRTPTTYKLEVEGSSLITTKLYLGTSTAPATDTGTLNALVRDESTGEVKQRSIIGLPSGTQGDILYYNGTSWVVLNAGTNGYFLKTQGSGANPKWDNPSTSTSTFKKFASYYTDVSTSGTTETTLYSTTLSSGFLNTNGDTIEGKYYIFGNSITDAVINLYIFGQSISFGVVNLGSSLAILNVTIIRVSNTTIRIGAKLSYSNAPYNQQNYVEKTGLDLEATGYDIILKGQAPTSGSLTAKEGYLLKYIT